MKTNKNKTKTFIVLTIVIITVFGQNINAENYQTFYLDSINNNDTIIYCSGNDSIELISPEIADNICWMINNYQDTICLDTLILPNGHEGFISCQGSGIVYGAIHLYIYPFTVDAGEDKTIICGGTAQLEVTSNYTGTDILTYTWAPTAGLDDSTISNPTVAVTDNIEYSVTILTPNGCQSTDSINIYLQSINNPNICIVGVDSTNKNIIVWEKPLSAPIDSFYIYKETNVTNVYHKISTVAYDDYSVYVDTSSNPNIQSNKYKISLKDACGFESDKSPFHKTMHLSLNQGQNNVWNLIWESYEGFTVSTYYINRGTDQNDLQLIGTSTASNTQYSDFSAPTGYVYYQIEIISPNECNPEKSSSNIRNSKSLNISRSNIVTNNPQGVIENSMNSKLITIYPNPAKSEVILELKKNNITNGTIEIINMNGQVIKKVIVRSRKTIINIDELDKGIYTINIKTDKGLVTQKLIKM